MGMFQDALNGLRVRLAKFAGDPAAAGATELVRLMSAETGVQRPTRRTAMDERWRLFNIERGRFYDYRDMWAAICESEIVERALLQGAEDATAEPFDIRCEDARGEREIWEMLDRVRYWEQRLDQVALLWGLGDGFNKIDYDSAPFSKRNLKEIVGMRRLPEYTMYRNSTPEGGLRSLTQAFIQFTDIDLVTASPFDSLVSANGQEVYASPSRVPGVMGVDSGYEFKKRSDAQISFRAEEIIHGRRLALFRPLVTGYGVPVLRSSKLAYNAMQSVLHDLVIDRNLATRNNVGVEFDPLATNDSVKQFEDSLFETRQVMNLDGTIREIKQRRRSSPDDWHWVKGGKFVNIGSKQALLDGLDDVHLVIDRLELCFGITLATSGFRAAKRVSGQMQERMEERAKRTIRGLNTLEEYGILRPLIDRQLYYSGKLGTKYEIRFPEFSMEDRNRRSKRVVSEVMAGLRSRRTGSKELYQMTNAEFDQELLNMEEEIERIGPVVGYQAPPESLDKGKKGVENKDSSTQNIANEYNTE